MQTVLQGGLFLSVFVLCVSLWRL